jgi:hypothetical protein
MNSDNLGQPQVWPAVLGASLFGGGLLLLGWKAWRPSDKKPHV